MHRPGPMPLSFLIKSDSGTTHHSRRVVSRHGASGCLLKCGNCGLCCSHFPRQKCNRSSTSIPLVKACPIVRHRAFRSDERHIGLASLTARHKNTPWLVFRLPPAPHGFGLTQRAAGELGTDRGKSSGKAAGHPRGRQGTASGVSVSPCASQRESPSGPVMQPDAR